MLNKLSLRSYQAHEDTVLEFSSGVNLITGVSDSGKSSIVRALNLVVNNRPLGDGYINDDKDKTVVLLEFSRRDHLFKIERVKDRKSNNSYKLMSDIGDDEVFTAFGASVPEEISSLLNLSDINIQQQLSPYFLVLDSPGQVALHIRKVARLNEIDDVVSILASEIRDCLREKSNLGEELLAVKEELTELSAIDLDRFENIINEIKLTDVLMVKNANQLEEIKTIIELVQQLDRTMVHLPDDIEDKIDIVDTCLSDYEDLLDESGYLTDIVTLLKEVEEKKIILPKDVENNISFIEILISKYNNSELGFIYLMELIENLEDINTQVKVLKEEYNQVEKEEKKLLSQLTNCPACGMFLTTASQKVLIGE